MNVDDPFVRPAPSTVGAQAWGLHRLKFEEIVERYLAGDQQRCRQLLVEARAEGGHAVVGAFLWVLARLVTECAGGPVTPNPLLPYDTGACEFINTTVPAIGAAEAVPAHAVPGNLLVQPWLTATDPTFGGFACQVLFHAARWPRQLRTVMAGGEPHTSP